MLLIDDPNSIKFAPLLGAVDLGAASGTCTECVSLTG